ASPSEKYSWFFSGLMSTKGSTAIDGVEACASGDAVLRTRHSDVAAMPTMITAIVATSAVRAGPAARALAHARAADGRLTTDDPDCTARSSRVRSACISAAF